MEKQKRFIGWQRETIATSFNFDDKLFMISKNSLKKGIIETFHFTKRTFGVEMITSDLESLNGFEFFAAASISKDKILITGMCELLMGTTILKVFLLSKKLPSEGPQNFGGVGILYNFQMIPIQVPNPIEMEDYTLNIVGDKAVFHGGRDKEGNIKSTTYILNLSINAENPQNNPAPPQQGGGGMFGGGRPPPRQPFVVEAVQAEPERSPEARFNHCSVTLNDSVYIFSGEGLDKKILHDLWKLNLTTRQWTKISLPDLDRFGRIGGVATTDQKKIYITGGSDANGVLLNDVILFNPKSETIQVYKFEPFSDLPHSIHYNWGKIMIARDREIRVAGFESEPYLEINGISGVSHQSQDSNLKKFFTEMPHSDITFKVEGQEIPGHKGLLAVRCPHFGRAFSSNMKESFSDMIEIPDMKADVFKGLLEYLYCGKIPKEEKLAVDLFEVSEMYLLPDLRKKCEHFLIQSLRSDNVINLALLAQRFGAEKLKKTALQFLSINRQNIADTEFHQLDKDFLIELVKFRK